MIFGNIKINTVVSILFAPIFVLGMYIWDFKGVALWFSVFLFGYLLFLLLSKKNIKIFLTPLVYFIFIVIAYFLNSVSFVKLIPALLSGAFFFFFFFSYLANKKIVLSFAKRFSPKELDLVTQEYIGKSDIYWSVVLFINTMIQVFLVFYKNLELWAFYSSIGWYIYMFIALTIQIIYVKMQIRKWSQ